MELLHIKTFVLAAKYLNFTYVADQMYISQPSISKYILALESELGEPLFNRVSRNVSLTDFGKAFLPYAKELLEKEESIMEFLYRYQYSGTPSLNIGVVEGMASAPNVSLFNSIMSSIGSMRAAVPGISIRLRVCEEMERHILIDNGKLDVVIFQSDLKGTAYATTSNKKAFQFRQLQKTDNYLAVPPRIGADGSFEDVCRRLDTLFFISEPVSKAMTDLFLGLYRLQPHLRTCASPTEQMFKIISGEGSGIIQEHDLSYMNYCGIHTIPLSPMGIGCGYYALWHATCPEEGLAENPHVTPFLGIISERLTIERARSFRFAQRAIAGELPEA